MVVRGIRGAITVERNEEAEILNATIEMLGAIVAENNVKPEDIAHVFVTVTQDLDAAFPAKAIRQMPGWELVPLMCALEIPVPGGLPRCIRLMVSVNTEKAQHEIHHVYLNDAKKLRPDLSETSRA
ncbi:chorismate mutase [Paenibacillus flagellatus]|uniref:chorismate mutase n=1 Tax=Paenibacillus flagellatus TaxID=2211139 RepID=A0A2V5KT98_9BACL|nr:chorismate mutase [Paenibacillus flagellatus]PYI54917.1 chorismate mutase [Paenibacillus flagellatus]